MSPIPRSATGAPSAAASRMPIPASELPACMLALSATIVVRGPGGERRIAAEDFFTGIYETALVAGGIAGRGRIADRAQRIPRISSTNSRGGTAITPLSASRRRRSLQGDRFADLRLGLFRRRRPAGAGEGGRQSCIGVADHAGAAGRCVGGAWRRARSARRPAGVACDAPASGKSAAGALRGRAARPPRSRRRRYVRDGAMCDLARRQRRARRRACAAAAQSGGFPARASAADRHACRLRAWRLRRLHGARQRRDRAFLPDAGGAGARRVGRDHRGTVRLRRDRRSAGGVSRSQRAAMRLLHAGHADGGAGSAASRAASRTASRSASISPAITAAAPAIRPSSTRSRATRAGADGAQP